MNAHKPEIAHTVEVYGGGHGWVHRCTTCGYRGPSAPPLPCPGPHLEKAQPERIDWRRAKYSETGYVNGLNLFSVASALSGGGYRLRTTLPVKSPVLADSYPTETHAKIEAERLLRAFIARIHTWRADDA